MYKSRHSDPHFFAVDAIIDLMYQLYFNSVANVKAIRRSALLSGSLASALLMTGRKGLAET